MMSDSLEGGTGNTEAEEESVQKKLLNGSYTAERGQGRRTEKTTTAFFLRARRGLWGKKGLGPAQAMETRRE